MKAMGQQTMEIVLSNELLIAAWPMKMQDYLLEMGLLCGSNALYVS